MNGLGACKRQNLHDRSRDDDSTDADADGSARVMAIVIHPYIMGARHRLKYFRRVFETIRRKPGVLFWTGEQILDWYLAAGRRGPKPPS